MGRMASLPMFVKILKQRYSRFSTTASMIVSARSGKTASTVSSWRIVRVLLRAVGAYIDLNAVRAGIVREPEGLPFQWIR